MTGPVLRMRGALSSAWRPCLAYLDSGFVAGGDYEVVVGGHTAHGFYDLRFVVGDDFDAL